MRSGRRLGSASRATMHPCSVSPMAFPSSLIQSPLNGAGAAALNLPKVSLPALRHTHASSLIASGLDVLTISRQPGQSKPSITLDVCSHLFKPTDRGAAAIFDQAL